METDWSDKTIVIVDDIEVNSMLIMAQLRKFGPKFVWHKNGAESVEYIKNGGIADIILMDVRMPIMNGIEATKQIKQIRPELPIIMQTACVMGNDCDDLDASDCDDFIYKPIIGSLLIEKIKKLI